MAHTVRMPSQRGLRLEGRQAVARLARVIGDDRRSELLIFCHEFDGSTAGLLEPALRAFAVE